MYQREAQHLAEVETLQSLREKPDIVVRAGTPWWQSRGVSCKALVAVATEASLVSAIGKPGEPDREGAKGSGGFPDGEGDGFRTTQDRVVGDIQDISKPSEWGTGGIHPCELHSQECGPAACTGHPPDGIVGQMLPHLTEAILDGIVLDRCREIMRIIAHGT